jgi:hypothetical protein
MESLTQNSVIDNINLELDDLSEKTFRDIHSAWLNIEMILERWNIEVPEIEEFEPEMIFKLYINEDKTSFYYLYINIDYENFGYVVYANFLTPEELEYIDNDNED